MSLPPITMRPVFPAYRPVPAAPLSDSRFEGVLLAQAAGLPPAPPSPKFELLPEPDYLKKSVPRHILPVEGVKQVAFYNSGGIDTFLAVSSIASLIKLNGKTIGTLIMESGGVSKQMAEKIIAAVEAKLKLDPVADLGADRSQILPQTKDFVALNTQGHGAVNYFQRLLYLDDKLGPHSKFRVAPEAQTLFLRKIVELQDILYESYKNAAGRLLQADPTCLNREESLVQARLMLATGMTDPATARQDFAERSGVGERDTERLAEKLRDDLARNWYQTNLPAAAPAAAAVAEGEVRPQAQPSRGAQAADEEETPPGLQHEEGTRRREVHAAATAEASTETGVEASAGAAAEAGEASSFFYDLSRQLEAWARLGFLNGSRLWDRPPQLGKRISGGSRPLRSEVNPISELNHDDLNANGFILGFDEHLHPFGLRGVPFGSPFALAGLETGYAHAGENTFLIDAYLGVGLNLVRLFEPAPSFDVAVRAALFRFGYNDFLGGYYDLGPSKYGVCGRLKGWQACFDYSRIADTDASEDSQRPGEETNTLDTFLFSAGHFFQLNQE